MEEQWLELKETITEMRDNGGTGTQQEVCQYLINLMNVLEKQIQGSCEDCCDGAQNEKAKLCQKSYLAGMEHYKNLHSCDNAVYRQALLAKAEEEAKGIIVKPMPVDVSDIAGIRLMTRAEVIAFRDNAGAASAREILKYNGPWLTADEGSHPDTRLCVAGPSEPWLWEGVDSQEDGIGIRPVLTLKHGIIPDEEPGRTCVLFGEVSWLCVGSNLYLCEKTLWTDSYGDAGSMQKKLHKWLEDAA